MKVINDKTKPLIANPFSFLLKPIAHNVITNIENIATANKFGINIRLSKAQLKDEIPQKVLFL